MRFIGNVILLLAICAICYFPGLILGVFVFRYTEFGFLGNLSYYLVFIGGAIYSFIVFKLYIK